MLDFPFSLVPLTPLHDGTSLSIKLLNQLAPITHYERARLADHLSEPYLGRWTLTRTWCVPQADLRPIALALQSAVR
jgi:hypothetical protein